MRLQESICHPPTHPSTHGRDPLGWAAWNMCAQLSCQRECRRWTWVCQDVRGVCGSKNLDGAEPPSSNRFLHPQQLHPDVCHCFSNPSRHPTDFAAVRVDREVDGHLPATARPTQPTNPMPRQLSTRPRRSKSPQWLGSSSTTSRASPLTISIRPLLDLRVPLASGPIAVDVNDNLSDGRWVAAPNACRRLGTLEVAGQAASMTSEFSLAWLQTISRQASFTANWDVGLVDRPNSSPALPLCDTPSIPPSSAHLLRQRLSFWHAP